VRPKIRGSAVEHVLWVWPAEFFGLGAPVTWMGARSFYYFGYGIRAVNPAPGTSSGRFSGT
jgi:hypothetical protein